MDLASYIWSKRGNLGYYKKTPAKERSVIKLLLQRRQSNTCHSSLMGLPYRAEATIDLHLETREKRRVRNVIGDLECQAEGCYCVPTKQILVLDMQ